MTSGLYPVGAMVETLQLHRFDPPLLTLASLSRVGALATGVSTTPHRFVTGDYAAIGGASPFGYNGKFRVTVTTTTEFTYPVSTGLATPASGRLTAVYVSNAQGGKTLYYRPFDTCAAEMTPLRVGERIQLEAVQSDVQYRFRIRARVDLDPTMRVVWTPSFPDGASPKTLAIIGILPIEDGRTWQSLELAEVAA